MPAMIAGALLCIAVIVVWITVIDGSTKQAASITCTPPSAGKTAGTALAADALDNVRPLPANQVQVRVLNAAEQRGEAGLVTVMLQQLGFSQTGAAGNDPLYAKSSMDCRGQIRFGAAGASAARTVSLLDPCSQLVRDSRKDATVDFVLGDKFDDLRPNDAARKVLQQIASAPSPTGSGQAADEVGIDQNLLKQARDRTNCG